MRYSTFSPRVDLPFCKENRNIFEYKALCTYIYGLDIILLYNDQTNLIQRFSSITSIEWQLCMKGNKLLCVTFEIFQTLRSDFLHAT